MPVLSVFITSLCIGSPLAMNVEALKSPFGLAVLLVVIGFHATGFLFGFYLPGVVFWKSSHQRKVQKTISFEIGISYIQIMCLPLLLGTNIVINLIAYMVTSHML